jgi:hypothetical protein
LKLELAEQRMAGAPVLRGLITTKDGKLDLFVCNYILGRPNWTAPLPFELPHIGRSYGPAAHFEGGFSLL